MAMRIWKQMVHQNGLGNAKSMSAHRPRANKPKSGGTKTFTPQNVCTQCLRQQMSRMGLRLEDGLFRNTLGTLEVSIPYLLYLLFTISSSVDAHH